MHKDKNLELFRYLKPGTKTAGVLEFGPDDSIQITTLYIGHKEEQYLILELSQKATEALTLRKLINVDNYCSCHHRHRTWAHCRV